MQNKDRYEVSFSFSSKDMAWIFLVIDTHRHTHRYTDRQKKTRCPHIQKVLLLNCKSSISNLKKITGDSSMVSMVFAKFNIPILSP